MGSLEEARKLLAYGIRFRGSRYRTEHYGEVGVDIVCPLCSRLGDRSFKACGSNPLYCFIYTGPYEGNEHTCRVLDFLKYAAGMQCADSKYTCHRNATPRLSPNVSAKPTTRPTPTRRRSTTAFLTDSRASPISPPTGAATAVTCFPSDARMQSDAPVSNESRFNFCSLIELTLLPCRMWAYFSHSLHASCARFLRYIDGGSELNPRDLDSRKESQEINFCQFQSQQPYFLLSGPLQPPQDNAVLSYPQKSKEGSYGTLPRQASAKR